MSHPTTIPVIAEPTRGNDGVRPIKIKCTFDGCNGEIHVKSKARGILGTTESGIRSHVYSPPARSKIIRGASESQL